MQYKIHALCNGNCVIAGNHTFYKGNPEERYQYTLLLWLIEGGDKPILVDAGLTRNDIVNSNSSDKPT
jgi:hypothetical protein